MRPQILDDISDEEILVPRPRVFKRQIEDETGKTVLQSITIYPASDSLISTITKEISQIIHILDGVAKWSTPGEQNDLNIASLAPALPKILEILWPSATTIIATCLKIDESVVANEWWMDEKMNALECVIKANRLDLLAKKLVAMAFPFRQQGAQEPKQENPSPQSSLQEPNPEIVSTPILPQASNLSDPDRTRPPKGKKNLTQTSTIK